MEDAASLRLRAQHLMDIARQIGDARTAANYRDQAAKYLARAQDIESIGSQSARPQLARGADPDGG